MTARPRLSRAIRQLLFALAALIALAHAAGVVPMRLVALADLAIADARLRGAMPGTLDPRIVIVDIDEKSLGEVGRWPWPRDRMARLVDELFANQRAAVVGFDVVFSEPDPGGGAAAVEQLALAEPALAPRLAPWRARFDLDARLTEALRNRLTVLGYFLTVSGGERHGALPEPVFDAAALQGRPIGFIDWEGYAAPLPAFAAVAAGAGFINSLPDIDGVVRSLPLIARIDGRIVDNLALAMLRTYTGRPAVEPVLPQGRLLRDYDGLAGVALVQGAQRLVLPVDRRLAVRVPYRGEGGPRGGSFEYVSAADLLAGRIPSGHLAGKLVLVGSSTVAMFDLRATPVASSYPGVEVHANLLSGLLDGALPLEPDWARAFEAGQVLLVAALLAYALPRLSAVPAVATSLGLATALVAVNWWSFRAHGLALPLASALLLVIAVHAVAISWGWIVERRSRHALARLFGTYVPPERVAEMARRPENFDMSAENRELTVMFCDMRDFTKVSEKLSPEALRMLINRFFSRMTASIRAERGTLDKYIGDAIMAFWGAPIADARHAEHAVRAALAMARGMDELNAELRAQGMPEVGIGIGLNTGLVCVGDMGSDVRRSYTVMGDAVNLASRIEGLTRHYGVNVLVGDATRREADPARAWVEVDRVRVKGKAQAVTLFTPVPDDGAAVPDRSDELRLWQLALDAHRLHHWDESLARLAELGERHSGSVFSGLYRQLADRNARYRTTPPAPDWDGTHTFDAK